MGLMDPKEYKIDCPWCGKEVRFVLKDYDFIIYNIGSDSLHECYAKERSIEE